MTENTFGKDSPTFTGPQPRYDLKFVHTEEVEPTKINACANLPKQVAPYDVCVCVIVSWSK